jgi:GNAT superfamily N-acetyltransferase
VRSLPRILTDGSDKALVDAIEQNCIDFFTEYGRGPGGEIHDEDGVTWFTTGLADPLFNGVMTAHLAPENVNRRIDDLLTEFRARGLPLEWTVGPSTLPPDLGTNLMAKGLSHLLLVPGMAVDLPNLPEEPLPKGLTIHRATRPDEIAAGIRVFGTTFEIADSLIARLVEIELGRAPERRDSTLAFVGKLDGKVVASATVFLSGGVAGLYAVGTLATARGRGIARAMTTHALREARDRGYRFGTLQATAMGFPVYRRLGFREYTRFEIYS